MASWKGIPYASPPVGSLRFMPPEPLGPQNDSVIDVTTDALRCVQFSGAPYGVINGNIVGSRSGPGQEDCLKLWIWKPLNASQTAKLPVVFYIHVSQSYVIDDIAIAQSTFAARRSFWKGLLTVTDGREVVCSSVQRLTTTSAIGLAKAKISSRSMLGIVLVRWASWPIQTCHLRTQDFLINVWALNGSSRTSQHSAATQMT